MELYWGLLLYTLCIVVGLATALSVYCIVLGIDLAMLAAAPHREPFPFRLPRWPLPKGGIRTAQPKRGTF